MTINSQIRTAGPFVGTGVLVAYPFGFKVFQTSDLLLRSTSADGTITTLVLSSNYTVTLNADQDIAPGGVINLVVALPVGTSLIATSNIVAIQPTSLTNGGAFFAKVIEAALDRLTILMQQLGIVGIVQALRVPEIGGVPELPSAANRALRILSFDSLGNPLMIAGVDSGSAAALALDLASTALATKNAGQVWVNASLPYAIGTVGARLNQRIDVSDFPFLASASKTAAQNSTAIVAALAQCAAGKTLYFGTPGLYKVAASVVDAAIVLPIGVNLEMAPGAWLTADTSFGSFIAPLGRNRIRANIDGGGYPASGGVTGTWTIENVGIRSYFSAAIGRGAADVVLDGCHIKNVSYAVLNEGAQGWRVIDNLFERCKWSAALMGHLTGFDCVRNIVALNRFDDCGDYAVSFWEAVVGTGIVAYNVIADNVAKNCNQRTNGYAFGVEQGTAARQHHMAFVGNTYQTAGSVTVTTGGITISTCSDSIASGNTLTCPTNTLAKGINCLSAVNCVISGNTLNGWTQAAIDTDGSNGVTLSDNNIRDCGGTSPVYPAVLLARTMSTSNIRMSGGSVTISPAYAFWGSTVAAVSAAAAAAMTVKNISVKGVTFTNPNDRAVSMEGLVGNPIVNVEVSGLTVNGIGSVTFFQRELAYLSYCNDLTVKDNVAFDALRGIAAVNCVGGLIVRNEFKGTATISTLYDITGSTGLLIREDVVTTPVTTPITPTARLAAAFSNYAQRCSSIVTEAFGATGALATGATVTHGMFAAPTQVDLTCTTAAVAVAVTAKGATTFTVAFTGGGTQSFDWSAVIR